jgi:RNA recognition motif-containing protein
MAAQQSPALAEGRRIYVGNLLYSVTPTDIETLLQTAGFDYENIHISVDPVSGRNPGYCFIEFKTPETADAALQTLDGVKVYDRSLKVGPCTPKSNTPRDPSRKTAERPPTFERWGDWRGSSREQGATTTAPAGRSTSERASQQGPYGAPQHLDDMKAAQFQDGTRLYVGGLGKMIDQDHNDREMSELFEGFEL